MRLASVDLGLGNTSRVATVCWPTSRSKRGGSSRLGMVLPARPISRSRAGSLRPSGGSQVFAWSPDGNYIASASDDGSARVWDAKTGKPLRCFDQGPTLKCGIGWSPDSRKLAWGSCSDEAALRIWNRDTDKIAVVHGHGAQSGPSPGATTASMWPRAASIRAAAETGNVRIWDAEKLESVAQFTSTYHPDSVSWSPDDKLLAVATPRDGCIIWDVASQQQLPDMVMKRAMCAAWHPTDPQLAVGDDPGNCLIWDRRSQKAIRQWRAHQGSGGRPQMEWRRNSSSFFRLRWDGQALGCRRRARAEVGCGPRGIGANRWIGIRPEDDLHPPGPMA